MMEQKPFAAFIDLITFDQKINHIEKNILVLKKNLENALDKQREYAAQEVASQELINNLRVKITLQEKEIEEFDQQEKTKKLRINALSDYREIKALQADIASLKRMQLEHEHHVIDSWNKLEHAQKGMARLKEMHSDADLLIGQEIETLRRDIAQHADEVKVLLHDRPAKIQKVPQEWLDHYTIMASRVADPVVPVEYESCTACSTSIAKQDMLRLQKKALLQCKMCFRLLYLATAMHVDGV